jgi:CMP-N-acetylneuraminic acid synthetase
LLDKPLVAHIINAAREVRSARVVVSTNSNEIAEVARRHGAEVPFLRPDGISQANSSSLAAILHALWWFKDNEAWVPEFLAFCPPTNPFLRAGSIEKMFSVLAGRPDRNSIVTITQPRTHPFRIVKQAEDGTITNGIVTIDHKNVNDIERSQDWPVVWEGAAACRMSRSKYFLSLAFVGGIAAAQGKTYDVSSSLGFKIPQLEAFDIDEEQDFLVAEALAVISQRR